MRGSRRRPTARRRGRRRRPRTPRHGVPRSRRRPCQQHGRAASGDARHSAVVRISPPQRGDVVGDRARDGAEVDDRPSPASAARPRRPRAARARAARRGRSARSSGTPFAAAPVELLQARELLRRGRDDDLAAPPVGHPVLVAVGEERLRARRRRAGPSASPARSRGLDGRRRWRDPSGATRSRGSASSTTTRAPGRGSQQRARRREAEDAAADHGDVRRGRHVTVYSGPGAALGRRQPAALGGDRSTLHAVRRRDVHGHRAVAVLRADLVHLRRAHPAHASARSRGTCVRTRMWFGWSSRVRLPDAKTDESLSKTSVPSGCG